MQPRYIVFPGYVTSKNDGDRHFITFMQLCRLYGVNPAECINAGNERQMRGLRQEDLDKLESLHVSAAGRYRRRNE